MPTRPRIQLSKEELLRAEIPVNHVLVEMQYKSEDLKTLAGIHVGFNSELTYAADENDTSSHVADVAETWGIVSKTPQRLFFDKTDPLSMDWECDMELEVGDKVWFSILESKNAYEVECDGKIYRSIPYMDCYVAKRYGRTPNYGIEQTTGARVFMSMTEFEFIIPLNGYVLCSPCFMPKLSHLDAVSEDITDKTRGTIAFIGNAPQSYIRDQYNHIEELSVGDEVLFAPKTPLFYLERLKETACFNNGEMYWVVARRRIVMKLNNNGKENN